MDVLEKVLNIQIIPTYSSKDGFVIVKFSRNQVKHYVRKLLTDNDENDNDDDMKVKEC